MAETKGEYMNWRFIIFISIWYILGVTIFLLWLRKWGELKNKSKLVMFGIIVFTLSFGGLGGLFWLFDWKHSPREKMPPLRF